MARCARKACGRWRPTLLVRAGGLGLRLDDAWYCSATCLELAACERLSKTRPVTPAATAMRRPKLGGVLATLKRLPADVVEQAATRQAQTGLRIGTQLVELGAVSRFDLLRALASQSGVGFLTSVDAARVTTAPGNLSPQVVRALGLVPFEADHRHDVLKVACTAPVPRAAVAALRELTGSIIEPYLVADEQWPALAQAYGTSARARGPVYSTVSDVAAAAAHVADAAREAGEVRMTEARCDEHLWIRLDVGGHIEEFWLSERAEEPAARTARPKRSRPTRPRVEAALRPAFAPMENTWLEPSTSR